MRNSSWGGGIESGRDGMKALGRERQRKDGRISTAPRPSSRWTEDERHATHAKEKILKYFTPKREAFVKEYFADDVRKKEKKHFKKTKQN